MDQEVWKLIDVIDWTMSEGSSVLYILQCQDKDERERVPPFTNFYWSQCYYMY